VTAELHTRHSCGPVWIPKDTLDLYYNGFCNAVLWQLFHYVPVQMDFRLAEAHTLTQEWLAYQEANRLFADAVMADYQEGDVLWIQDYHLMLLPEMLKQRCPTMKVRGCCSIWGIQSMIMRLACCQHGRARCLA
jgi:trehalose 6-phosphate synthase/phosphatase